jgi:PhnB protein
MTSTEAPSSYVTDGRPHGFTSLTPFIVVSDAGAAIDFYTEVFGARLLSRVDGPPDATGRASVMHAELEFDSGRLQLSDPNPASNFVAPEPGAPLSGSIAVYVGDVDETLRRASGAGADVVEEASTFVSGDRFGAFVDPFGRRWAVMTRVEDISPEESERRVEEWASTQR